MSDYNRGQIGGPLESGERTEPQREPAPSAAALAALVEAEIDAAIEVIAPKHFGRQVWPAPGLTRDEIAAMIRAVDRVRLSVPAAPGEGAAMGLTVEHLAKLLEEVTADGTSASISSDVVAARLLPRLGDAPPEPRLSGHCKKAYHRQCQQLRDSLEWARVCTCSCHSANIGAASRTRAPGAAERERYMRRWSR